MSVRSVQLFTFVCLFLCGTICAQVKRPLDEPWPTYGGQASGQRYSSAAEITPANVAGLQPAWTYHTRALQRSGNSLQEAAFEATPVFDQGALFLSGPFDQVMAVDAASGQERWRFDPHLPAKLSAGVVTSRGVALWHSREDHNAACAQRVFIATLDARLIALSAADGKPCAGFGVGGTVDLKAGVATQLAHPYQEFGNTSAPTVVGDVVVLGSAIADGQEVDVEPGLVRGYDVHSGELLWSWDPMPWAQHQAVRTGGGNTWSTISADIEHGLVFLPTGSPSPDFYGGMRPGDDRDADSVVALNAKTGSKVWAFQVVHHNLWDYDVAAEPLLFEYQGRIPAVAITTKMGMVFVLNRLTGEPIYPVTERSVPQTHVPGEATSPTQPFSSLPPLSPLTLSAADLPGQTAANVAQCSAQLNALRNEGIYTPPSTEGSILYPGSLGGVNWGSPAFDPESGILYVNSNHHAFRTRLIPRWQYNFVQFMTTGKNYRYVAGLLLLLLLAQRRSLFPGWPGSFLVVFFLAAGWYMDNRAVPQQHFGHEVAEQRKAPYAVERAPIVDRHGLPCTPTPWGKITALNLNTGSLLWEHALGSMVPDVETGSINLGGPLVTRGGLVFTAATRDPKLRAFNKQTGALLWTGTLPVPAQATPMSYQLNGRQYIVIAAGGHGGFETKRGDSLVAFALPH